MQSLAFALLGVGALLQRWFVVWFPKPALRAGWRGRTAECLLWLSVVELAIALTIGQ
jgi:hypothetical protein